MSSRAGKSSNRDRKPDDLRGQDPSSSRPDGDEGIEIIEVVGVDETTGAETGGPRAVPAPAGERAGHDDGGRSPHPPRDPGAAREPRHGGRTEAADPLQEALREKEKYYDLLLRKQAEFENYRKRSEREKHESETLATAEVIKRLLPVLDNLERALRTSEGSDTPLRQGVLLIQQQILDVLKKLGVQAMETLGRTFDPRLHEAVDVVDVPGFEQGVILEETQRGYTLHDRMLRPAMVRVASGGKSQGSESGRTN